MANSIGARKQVEHLLDEIRQKARSAQNRKTASRIILKQKFADADISQIDIEFRDCVYSDLSSLNNSFGCLSVLADEVHQVLMMEWAMHKRSNEINIEGPYHRLLRAVHTMAMAHRELKGEDGEPFHIKDLRIDIAGRMLEAQTTEMDQALKELADLSPNLNYWPAVAESDVTGEPEHDSGGEVRHG